MDAKFIIVMLAFIVVGIPVILGVGSQFFKDWLSHRREMMKLMADQTAEKAAQYAAQVERLEQRMRVLERIATDRGLDLAAQIDDLRDPEYRGEKLQ